VAEELKGGRLVAGRGALLRVWKNLPVENALDRRLLPRRRLENPQEQLDWEGFSHPFVRECSSVMPRKIEGRGQLEDLGWAGGDCAWEPSDQLNRHVGIDA
jgi:hypothetical protein